MIEYNLIWLLITALCVAEFSIQVAYQSTLAESIKKLLLLSDTQIRKWKPWWQKIRELASCPYCQSTWYMFFINSFMYEMNIGHAIIYAMLAPMAVEIIRKIS